MCVINNKGNYLSYSLHQQITDVTACETWILETSSAFLKFDFTIVFFMGLRLFLENAHLTSSASILLTRNNLLSTFFVSTF